jgi:DNA-binding NarL/FixJ family response regulator
MVRIIIADDHAFVRKGIKELLASTYPAAEIIDVENGESLLKEILFGEWDIVLCDLNMPGKGGMEILYEVSQYKPDLPVLIMSISSDDEYATQFFKAGAAGYINKNNIHEELIGAVEKILTVKNHDDL